MATQYQPFALPVPNTSSLTTRSSPRGDTRRIHVAVIDGEPGCTPEEKTVKKETERQDWFQTEANDKLNIPNGYLEVNVLIIRWHEELDEFEGHNDEVGIHYG